MEFVGGIAGEATVPGATMSLDRSAQGLLDTLQGDVVRVYQHGITHAAIRARRATVDELRLEVFSPGTEPAAAEALLALYHAAYGIGLLIEGVGGQ